MNICKKYLLLSALSLSIVFHIACKEKPKELVEPIVSEKAELVYQETHRPQYHFSPEQMWMNDPNGMVYYEGEYHLFYQHYPDSNVWGPMHWGHAVSTDLVFWEHLPIALYPDELGCIFSGSAVIDWNNTTGFGENDKPPLIAIFTHHNFDKEKAKTSDHQYQSIAYSNDKGRSWNKYEGNPVIPNTEKIFDFRDPKVIWHEDSKKWVLALAAKDRLHIYNSPDLKTWEKVSEFGANEGNHDGVWECPDFFPLQVEGTDETKWVLIQNINPGNPNGGSGVQYFVGDFDGKNFENEYDGTVELWLDQGKDNYAGVTWSDVPETDGRRLFMGWMSNWQYAQIVPTTKWRSAMTLARELKLINTPQGYRVTSHSIKEMDKLRTNTLRLNSVDIKSGKDYQYAKDNEGLQEIEIQFETNNNEILQFEFSNEDGEMLHLELDIAMKNFLVDKSKSGIVDFNDEFGKPRNIPLENIQEQFDLKIYLDHASIEILANKGQSVVTEIFFSKNPLDKLSIKNAGEVDLQLDSLSIHQLKSIWN